MYLALFNSEYKTQFEITIKEKTFNKILKRHKNNVAEACEEIFTHFYKPKKTTTPKKRKSFRDYISYNFRNLGGESSLVIERTKQDLLRKRMRRRGLGGISIYPLGGGEFRARRY